MLRRSAISIAFVLMFFLPSAISQTAKAHRVVFAVTSADETDWKLMLGNIRNLLAGLPPNSTDVEVVAYGPGLALVRKPSSANAEIQDLEAMHVRFVACENSMRMQHVTAEELVQGVQTVPSGVTEVVLKQELGWSYIKAGR